MPKKYIVKLTPEEKQQLLDIIKKGKASAREIRRVHTLLMTHEGKTSGGDRQNATHLDSDSGEDAKTVCRREYSKLQVDRVHSSQYMNRSDDTLLH